MYLFLVTLGYDLKDIVSFMTSPAAEFINSMSESNIYLGQNISVKQAIAIAEGDYTSYVRSFLKSSLINNKNVVKSIIKGDYENNFGKGSKEYYQIENARIAVAELNYIKSNIFKAELEKRRSKIKEGEEFNEESELKKIELEFDQDVAEFKHVFEGADEFTQLGTVLGLNQGLKTSKFEQQSFIQKIQNILLNRQAKYNEEHEEDPVQLKVIDVKRFFIDPEYQEEIVQDYNKVKECINIFDLLRSIPQYNAIMKIFAGVIDSDISISIKSKLYDDAYLQLKSRGYSISDDYSKRMLAAIDTLLISKFAKTLDIKVPYLKGTKLLTDYRTFSEAPNNGLLELNETTNLASFKYIFENYIIPNLKRGVIVDYVDGNIVERVDESLKSNQFVLSLMRDVDNQDVPLYKCDIDMLTVDSSPYSRVKLHNYVKGLQQLSKIKVNGTPLSNLFMLYNILVNKNKYGSDRMTTLFESFIDTNKDSMYLIKDYLNFIGHEDYFAKASDYDYDINDIMYLSSATKNSDYGMYDPSYIQRTNDGLVFMVKNAGEYGYSPGQEIIPKIANESKDQYLSRMGINRDYFVNGETFTSANKEYLQNIYNINENTLDTLATLISKGIIEFKRICI